MHLTSVSSIIFGLTSLSSVPDSAIRIAAEPASILYIASGVMGLVFARLHPSKGAGEASVPMLFCQRSIQEKLGQQKLT